MKFEIYRNGIGFWCWRLRGESGKVVADSGPGFRFREDCEKSLASVKNAGSAPVVDTTAA